MPKRTQSYDAWQLDKLSHPEAAAAFLNAAWVDSQEMFLVALRKVAQVKQMAAVAKEANIQRETLYHALSVAGNPTLQTLSAVLEAVGLRLSVESKRSQTKTPSLDPFSFGECIPAKSDEVLRSGDVTSTAGMYQTGAAYTLATWYRNSSTQQIALPCNPTMSVLGLPINRERQTLIDKFEPENTGVRYGSAAA